MSPRNLAKAANYTCVQTIDRSYFESANDLLQGCAYESKTPARKPLMHDRLRLDIAVSEGQEIYSWHGENKFSASTISEVVRSGPISSGSFVGFLHNIFLFPGVQFTYTGKSEVKGTTVYGFDYVVPLGLSRYHVQGRGGESPIIPYHGSFTVNAADYQLRSLRVIGDSIPANANICSADTEVDYQMVEISGRPALIPATFLLQIDDQWHLYTISRSEYSQCREFRGESTLRFDVVNTPAPSAAAPPIVDEWLPAGISLRIGLRTPVDDRTSYTGDPVEGVLLAPVHVPGTNTVIPKNAVLHGIITELEFHNEPWKHRLVNIEFNRITYGKNSFLLKCLPKTTKKDIQKLVDIYGWPLPHSMADKYQKGVFVITSSHVHLDAHFSGEWVTVAKPEEKTALLAH